MAASKDGGQRRQTFLKEHPECQALFPEPKPLGYYKSGDKAIIPAPPADHPRRCQHLRTYGAYIGTRCKKWALKGATRCARHGGRTQQRFGGKISTPKFVAQGTKGLPVFYGKVLGKTLHDKLKELVEAPNHEQLNMREEVHLAKISAADMVQLYDGVSTLLESCPDDNQRKKLAEAKLVTGAQMRAVLGDVIDMCDKVVRIEAGLHDKVTIQNIVIIVNQISRLAYEVFGEEHMDKCLEFERRIKAEVRLPSEGPEGTTITPDQDVLEMDDTIPALPDFSDSSDDESDSTQAEGDDDESEDSSSDDGTADDSSDRPTNE